MSDLTSVVLDVEDIRFKKVLEEVPSYRVTRTGTGKFTVKKGDHEYHVELVKKGVTAGSGGDEVDDNGGLVASCDCPDWNFHARKLGVPCKHIWLGAKEEGLVAFPRFDPIAGPVPNNQDEEKEKDKVKGIVRTGEG